MGGLNPFKKPKAPAPIVIKQPKPEPIPEPDTTIVDQQSEADAAAAEEAEELRRGRVKTILTSGQGLSEEETARKKRKTVLGG